MQPVIMESPEAHRRYTDDKALSDKGQTTAIQAHGREVLSESDALNNTAGPRCAGQESRLREAPDVASSEESEPKQAIKDAPWKEHPVYPLHAFPSTRVVMVDVEGMRALIGGEDRRLQRVLAEGMILREVIYLATSRQPLPDPRGRAEIILRRHWPFQYTALRSVGLLGEAYGNRRNSRELAGEN